ncbi:MAG: hypothetical protein LBU50_03385 [Cellulomonas sp.]|jgi:hypothetical protein|nr:hypothetical protein [Cellulomonas sp.]
MSSYGQDMEAVAAAHVALAVQEPPEPDVVEAVADGLRTVSAPLLMVPHPRAVSCPGTRTLARRRA